MHSFHRCMTYVLFCATAWLVSSQMAAAQEVSKSNKSEVSSKEISAMVKATERLAGEYQLRIGLGNDAASLKLRPGVASTIPLKLRARGFQSDFDVYVLTLMSERKRLVVERVSKEVVKSNSLIRSLGLSLGSLSYSELGTVNNRLGVPLLRIGYVDLQGLDLRLAGKVGSGAISSMAISPDNYPVNFTLPFETLGRLFKSFLGDKADAKTLAHFKTKNEKFPVMINMAYLCSISKGETNLDHLAVKITPPKSVFFYDGVVLAPALVKRFPNGLVVLLYNDKRANRLVVPSYPPQNTKRPKENEIRRQGNKPLEVNGQLTAFTRRNTELTIGRRSTVEFEVTYRNLKPSSEIYMVLQPANGSKIIQISNNAVISTSTKSATMKLYEDPKLSVGMMKVQDSGIILAAPLFIGKLEAGKLGSVEKGGDGRISGRITFTPPPLNVYYDRIRATPVAMSWTEDGRLYTVFDNSKSNYVEIKIKGR